MIPLLASWARTERKKWKLWYMGPQGLYLIILIETVKFAKQEEVPI